MLIRSPAPWDEPEANVTPESLYLNRREIMTGLAAGFALPWEKKEAARNLAPLKARKSGYAVPDALTPYEDIAGYNNYYEFGVDKDDPARNAHRLKTSPWSVRVDGLCGKPGVVPLEKLIDFNRLEERIYRHRCVEAWSMVMPWTGVPLADVLQRFEPSPQAKFVAFETALQKDAMTGLHESNIDWPYREGLRMDEAMHPLAFLAVGLYGKIIPNQNGAPLRLALPWKYGFKSIKSIVRISFVAKQPPTSWNRLAPDEYGFYSNVNPGVDHPRWSQAKERRIGEWRKRDTLMFNGYGEAVAALYKGMDLKKYY